MKKVIFFLFLIAGMSVALNAQTTPKQEKKENPKMEMKNGVLMVDNKAMLSSNNTCTLLTKTYILKDSCKVSVDGTITKPDGSTMKLMNGYEISEDGKMSMIPHGEKGHVCTAACKKM